MAEHYLNKAREEAGASDFKDSVQLAHGAAEWADKAIIAIEKEGRDLDEAALPGETRTLTEEDRMVNETATPDTPTPDAAQTEETPEIPDDVTSPSDEPTPTADTPQKTAPDDNNEEAPTMRGMLLLVLLPGCIHTMTIEKPSKKQVPH